MIFHVVSADAMQLLRCCGWLSRSCYSMQVAKVLWVVVRVLLQYTVAKVVVKVLLQYAVATVCGC